MTDYQTVDELFPSKFMKATDLEDGEELVLIMDRVRTEEVGQDKELKGILYFEEQDKGLVLNRTNARILEELYGPNFPDWRGRKITLFVREVDFKGKTTLGLRVKAPLEDGGGGLRTCALPRRSATT